MGPRRQARKYSLTWLVARREFRERARTKAFWVASVIFLLGALAGAIIPALVKGSSGESTATVGVVVSNQSASMTQAVAEAGRLTHTKITVVPLDTVATGEAGLKSGTLSAVVVGGSEVLIKQEAVGASSGSGNTIADTLAQVVGLQRLFAALPAKTAESIASHGTALPVRALEPPPRGIAPRVTALVLSIVTYILILVYGMQITIGVGEEKSSRVVEVLLTTLRPVQLVTGKVLGMGALALAQMLALGTVYLVAAWAAGTSSVRGASPGVLAMGLLWLLLGYALYSFAFAAAGSLISRQADANNAAFPLYIPLIIGYVVTDTAVWGTTVSPFFRVLTFIPFTAPVTMPALFAIGAATWWEVLLSALITVVTIVAMVRLAGKVYERAILRTGTRLKLRQVLGTSGS
jgi:ABC-2 type transport system permease protein